MADDTQQAIDRQLARGGVETPPEEAAPAAPSYKMVGDSKIATSKEHGKLWQSRRDQALAKRRARHEDVAWRENIQYYNNHQVAYRLDSNGNWNRNDHLAAKMIRGHSETENIVFANTSAMVPSTYAKNPDVAVSAEGEDDDYPIPPELIEKLVNRLMQKRTAPGVNLKPHARRAVVHTTLTNLSYIEVGYTQRDQSNVQAMEDLEALSTKLAETKDINDIRQIEGDLEALEMTVDVLRPPGPWARFLRSDQVLRDPDSVNEDLSDCRWIMYWDYLSTAFIKAKFATPKGEGEGVEGKEWRSIYEPTHVMNLRTSESGGHQQSMAAPDEIHSFTLLNDDEKENDYSYYGYENERAWQRALRTKVWYVWDRVTQRLYLYNDQDWTWPIWVWDDPYNLEGFFPIYPLTFYTDPCEGTGKSEVSYYLDQQDAINTINSEFKQARQWAKRNIFYDRKKVRREDVEKYINGDEDWALGIDVPEGMKIDDIVKSVLPPSMEFVQLFDKAPILEAVDRVSSVTDVQRGAEFKTNTTNMAIENYTSNQQTRLDEKIDAVEDCIGKVGWALAQLCLQYMSAETVKKLIGRRDAEKWTNLSPDEITDYYSLSVVGGSSTKPTSSAQKQIALQMGQVLGQFVNAAPQATLGVLLRVFDRAFPEVQVTDEDWASLHEAVGSPGVDGGPSAEQGAEGDPIAQVEQIVDGLPPEAKQALGMAMARGVPVREALTRIMQGAQEAAAAPA